MSQVNRNAPKRALSSESTYTFEDFNRDFPDDATALEWLMRYLYPSGIFCPKCQKVTKHHRVKTRTSYSCQVCGHHEHPMRGTVFEDSATSLRLWFYAIFLMSQTRCGISAKQLERELGVTYKTAWRMFNKIRSMLVQDDDHFFTGPVEVDEAYIGGLAKWKNRGRKTGRPGVMDKSTVLGMVQRKGPHRRRSTVVAQVVPDNTRGSLLPKIGRKVFPASTVYTDDFRSYDQLWQMGYRHSRVYHSQGIYVWGSAHTNTIEGFWALLKSGIRGAYHGVSTKWLQSYVDEYVFRYNHRTDPRGMFHAFLRQIVKKDPATLF